MPPTPLPHPDDFRMTLGEHIEELRHRLIMMLVGIGVMLCLTAYYSKDLVAWVCLPLTEAQLAAGLPRQLTNHTVTAGLSVYLIMAFLAAAVLASPWILYQLWAFVSKGLYPAERKGFMTVAPLSAAMTVFGVVFAYYLIIPLSLCWLLAFTISFPAPDTRGAPSLLRTITRVFTQASEGGGLIPKLPMSYPDGGAAATEPAPALPGVPELPGVVVLDRDPPKPAEGSYWFNRNENELRIFVQGQKRIIQTMPVSLMAPYLEVKEYLWFFGLTMIIIVIAFQLPVLMLLLSMTGMVDPALLSRYRKYLVYALFVLCVVVAPSQDVFTNVALPLILWALFEFGLILMRLTWRTPAAENRV